MKYFVISVRILCDNPKVVKLSDYITTDSSGDDDTLEYAIPDLLESFYYRDASRFQSDVAVVDNSDGNQISTSITFDYDKIKNDINGNANVVGKIYDVVDKALRVARPDEPVRKGAILAGKLSGNVPASGYKMSDYRDSSKYQLISNVENNSVNTKIAEQNGGGWQMLFRVNSPISAATQRSPTQSTTGEGQTPDSGTQSITESKPIANGTYTFDVQKKGSFVISGQPELKLATEADLKRLQNQELIDDEYIESGYQGDDESTIGINPESTIEMRNEKDKELEEQYKKEQSGVSQQTDTGTGNNVQLIGGGSMKGGVKVSYTKKTPSWGKVTKGLTDAQLLKAMVDYIEGGYYYPGHAYSQFNERSRNLYGNSGETLWGIDRCAGQTENTELGKKFWLAFDKVSGHGDSTGTLAPLVPNKQTKKAEPVTYAQSTRTKEWDPNKYPAKAIALKYGKSPLPSTPGYDIMYNAFVDLAIGNLKSLSERNFKGHPLRDLIFSDTRLKFCWLRSTWNGSGWFSKFATNLKKVYDSGVKDVDSLIIADLNHRLTYNVELITHDVVKISQLLGIEPSSNVV
jgi:hypothetical protein